MAMCGHTRSTRLYISNKLNQSINYWAKGTISQTGQVRWLVNVVVGFGKWIEDVDPALDSFSWVIKCFSCQKRWEIKLTLIVLML